MDALIFPTYRQFSVVCSRDCWNHLETTNEILSLAYMLSGCDNFAQVEAKKVISNFNGDI